MKIRRIISVLLTVVMLFALVTTLNLTAFAENDNIELTVNIQPLKTSKSITISENAEYKKLKEQIENELGINFENDGYEIYCSDAGIYYHPSYAATLGKPYTDETKTLKELNFKNGYTINLEKLPWFGTQEKPIEIFGLKIWGDGDGIKGSCEPFCQGNYNKVDFYWNYTYKTITIRSEARIVISGVGEKGTHIITMKGSGNYVNLTISDLVLENDDGACISLNPGSWLKLTVLGENTLVSTGENAIYDINKTPAILMNNRNSWLNIVKASTGSLNATSYVDGQPGIGTNDEAADVWGIEINGGKITAAGGKDGAGIRATEICIKGGEVIANGGICTYGDGSKMYDAPFKIEGGILTASSDTKALNHIPDLTEYRGYIAKASVNRDGTEAEKYDSAKNDTYKYFQIISKQEITFTEDEPQEYIYDGTAKSFVLSDNSLEGFTVKYRQGEDEIGEPINAGSYDVIITRAEDDIYKSYSKTIENGLVIKPKTVEKNITLAVPLKNAMPQMSIDADEYTATVVWSPQIAEGGTFANSTEYTATITITPKTNYTVEGITENGYMVSGATSITNEADSNVITAVFPKTAGSSGGGGTTRYTVKFNTNGGNTITSQTVKKNSTATEPKAPTKDGYIFDGWYTDSNFVNEYDFDTKVTKNITLYARWTEDEVGEPSDDKKDDEQKPTADDRKNPFSDVKENDWFFDNVRYANENSLMRGVTNTEFAPNDNLTRGMLVTVLYRAEGEPAVNKSIPFADVNASQYYANAVIWAEQNGIVKGVSETEFAPDENITREQIATIIYRYAEYKGIAPAGAWAIKLDYADVADISNYAVDGVMYCTMKNIMQGKDNNMFAPKDNATRAETAAILQRFSEGNKS